MKKVAYGRKKKVVHEDCLMECQGSGAPSKRVLIKDSVVYKVDPDVVIFWEMKLAKSDRKIVISFSKSSTD